FEGNVGPEDAQVGLDDRDPFAEDFEDEIVLQQRAGPLPHLGLMGGSENAVEGLGLQQRQPFADAAGADHVPAGKFQLFAALGLRILKNQDSRSLRQRSPPRSEEKEKNPPYYRFYEADPQDDCPD